MLEARAAAAEAHVKAACERLLHLLLLVLLAFLGLLAESTCFPPRAVGWGDGDGDGAAVGGSGAAAAEAEDVTGADRGCADELRSLRSDGDRVWLPPFGRE